MIMPLDIQNMNFTKAVRGYKEEEVDRFLDLLTMDLEKLLEENRKYKEQIKVLTADLDQFKRTETTVLETLEAAKALMNDITASAEKRASHLLANAELDAELILRNARESVERLQEESGAMQNKLSVFKAKYKLLLESELNRFDSLSAELFGTELDPLQGLQDTGDGHTKPVR